MSIAGLSLWIGTYLIGQLTPLMLTTFTPAGTFWLFAVMCVPYMLIVWKLLPETTGKSLEEIEEMWIQKGKKQIEDGSSDPEQGRCIQRLYNLLHTSNFEFQTSDFLITSNTNYHELSIIIKTLQGRIAE